MSFNGFEDDNASSSRSVLQRSTHSLLANDSSPASFSISFTSPVPASNAAAYQDFSRQGTHICVCVFIFLYWLLCSCVCVLLLVKIESLWFLI